MAAQQQTDVPRKMVAEPFGDLVGRGHAQGVAFGGLEQVLHIVARAGMAQRHVVAEPFGPHAASVEARIGALDQTSQPEP